MLELYTLLTSLIAQYPELKEVSIRLENTEELLAPFALLLLFTYKQERYGMKQAVLQTDIFKEEVPRLVEKFQERLTRKLEELSKI